MKKLTAAVAAFALTATVAHAEPATLESENSLILLNHGILTTVERAGGPNGGVHTQTIQLPAQNVRACLSLAFTATQIVDSASVSCFDVTNSVRAIYTCDKTQDYKTSKDIVACERKF